MSKYRKVKAPAPVQIPVRVVETMQDQIKALQDELQQLKGIPEPDLRQKINQHLNGNWTSYKELSMSIFGNERQSQRIRYSVKKMDNLDKKSEKRDEGTGRRWITVIRKN